MTPIRIPRYRLLVSSLVVLVSAPMNICQGQDPKNRMELEQLDGTSPPPWLSIEDLTPRGSRYKKHVPDTLDLAERAVIALRGLTSFLDAKHHFSSYGHGNFSVTPPCLIHDHGMAQNWGKIAEAMVLVREMCGSRENLDRELASLSGMLRYALAKKDEPYPVPLARMLMSLEALQRFHPKPELVKTINQYRSWLVAKAHIDLAHRQAYFGPENRRWQRDDRDVPMGPIGYSLQMFTAGTVLRALVRAARVNDIAFDEGLGGLLKNYLLDARFWSPEAHAAMVVPAEHGHFWGHHHSYTQALLGLLYAAHHTNDARVKEFVRRSYEYLRTYGIARIGLFGEGCTVADMTYLAVRLSQWGVGDYWEDVDQYTRNHLTELQILDTGRLADIVKQHGKPLDRASLGAWCQGVDTNDVLRRCRGLFWSDASHPTLIPLRSDHSPHGSCLQWVVCCSGNGAKALYEVWNGIVEYDGATETARVNLLLNRASPWLDIDSYLPHEGKVVLWSKKARNLAVRVPRWADKSHVKCLVNKLRTPLAWVGNYLVLNDLKRSSTIEIRFPMVEATERHSLAWRTDQFWQESTKPPSSWGSEKPTVYTITLRGNTLADIHPRDPNVGFALYRRRCLNRFRSKAPLRSLKRFVHDAARF